MTKALAINSDGTLTRTTLIRDGEHYITDYNGPRYRVDATQTEKILGWGDMDGEAIALVDADYPSGPEFWIKGKPVTANSIASGATRINPVKDRVKAVQKLDNGDLQVTLQSGESFAIPKDDELFQVFAIWTVLNPEA